MDNMGSVFFNTSTDEYKICGWVVSAEQLLKLPDYERIKMLRGGFTSEAVWEMFSMHGVFLGGNSGARQPNDQAAIRHLVSMGREVLA